MRTLRLKDKEKENKRNELKIRKRTGFVRIMQVKFGDNLGSMSEFSSRNP